MYLGAVDWLRGILARAEVVESWNKPSAVARYTVGGLSAHAVHGVLWLEQVLKDAEPVGLRIVKVPELHGPQPGGAARTTIRSVPPCDPRRSHSPKRARHIVGGSVHGIP